MPNEIGEVRDSTDGIPLAYFITYSCYGTWIHGNNKGSVDVRTNQVGTPYVAADTSRFTIESERMDQPPYELDQARREVVLKTIIEVCQYRDWELLAVHVRSNHVHIVVRAKIQPEKIMGDFKSYSSRRLNEAGLDDKNRKRWTRHGSTIYLWDADTVEQKIHYTLHEQGDRMSVYPIDKSEPRPSGSV